MGLLGRWALLLFALLCSGCGSDLPVEADITIRFDTESIESNCDSAFCTDYPMTCGALVSLRVTDPKTGEVLLRDNDPNQPLSLCLQAPVSEDMCVLRDMNMQIFGIPAQNVRVEVALFNPDDGVAGRCPTPRRFELFDALGRPQSNYDPSPAFAGAAYFRAGEVANVSVPLYCQQSGLLSVDTCTANLPTDVRAVVTDLQSMQALRKEQASSVAVSVGEARSEIDTEGDVYFELEANDTHPLQLNTTGAIAVFEDAVDERFGPLVCTTALAGEPQATIAVHCEEVVNQAPELSLQPIQVSKLLVDAALAALGEPTFPEDGLIIGRVVDESFSPSSGVVVTPAQGSVLYLDEDLGLSDVALTSNSAYFVATDVPFGSTWGGLHFDGRRHSGAPRAGLIKGKVSTVIIRMTGDVIGE